METKAPYAESDLVQRIASERQAASRANKKRVRYSEALRDDIIQFVRTEKLSPETGARRLGLGKRVVRGWLRSPRPQMPQEQAARLHRVEVVSCEQCTAETELRLIFPGGAHVVLSLGQLRALIGGEA
jgi:DNA-binding transcriptional regulator YiaG